MIRRGRRRGEKWGVDARVSKRLMVLVLAAGLSPCSLLVNSLAGSNSIADQSARQLSTPFTAPSRIRIDFGVSVPRGDVHNFYKGVEWTYPPRLCLCRTTVG